jgi:hypothetical protein
MSDLLSVPSVARPRHKLARTVTERIMTAVKEDKPPVTFRRSVEMSGSLSLTVRNIEEDKTIQITISPLTTSIEVILSSLQ